MRFRRGSSAEVAGPPIPPTVRRLVPIEKQVWRTLKAEAENLSRHGKCVSPAQLAAMLVEKSVDQITRSPGDQMMRKPDDQITS